MGTVLRRDPFSLVLAIASVGAITAGYLLGLHLTNPTTAALTYLLVVLITAAASTLWVAIVASVMADLCLNYFFMPPFGTFRIADPQNWVALLAFFAVSVIGSRLSTAVRKREREARAQAAERAQLIEDRNAAELARKSEELKSVMLGSLGHNLKTPLTAIRLSANNLKASWLPETGREEQADVILVEVERLDRLFHNILELARIDAGAVAADRRWVHPPEIFEAARDQVEHSLRQHPVELACGSDDLVLVDPRITGSALAHLLENAAQYTRPGSPINVDMCVSSEGLTVRVRDHGPGIAAGDLPHLFDRFYRGTAASARTSGTGMGLSIARGMLSSERGRIEVENASDGGAQFTIFVPAERKAATAGGNA